MDEVIIAKLEELKETLAKAARLWKAEYRLEVITELHLSEVDTSSDAALEYRPGTISQVVTSAIRVQYSMDQPEELDTTYMIEMPHVPLNRIEAKYGIIQFHINAIRALLIQNAPDEYDWAEARAAYEKAKEE